MNRRHTWPMARTSFLLFWFAALFPLLAVGQNSPSAQVQPPLPFSGISYSLSMPRPNSHLFEVTMDLEAPAGTAPATVDLQMPMWQPGRYSVADFAENVQEFSA